MTKILPIPGVMTPAQALFDDAGLRELALATGTLAA